MSIFRLEQLVGHGLPRSGFKLAELTRERKLATNKLKRYYEKLGFVEMKSTPFMFFNMAWALPSVEELRSQKLIH